MPNIAFQNPYGTNTAHTTTLATASNLYNRYPYNTAFTNTANTLHNPYGAHSGAANPAFNPYGNLYNTHNMHTGHATHHPGRKKREELLANKAYCCCFALASTLRVLKP